jgi:hypothetical protein
MDSLAYPIVVVGAVDLRHPSPARGRVSTVGQRVGYVRVHRLHRMTDQGCQLRASVKLCNWARGRGRVNGGKAFIVYVSRW